MDYISWRLQEVQASQLEKVTTLRLEIIIFSALYHLLLFFNVITKNKSLKRRNCFKIERNRPQV